MIIRTGLIRHKDELDAQEFARHWIETHGPLAASVPTLRAYTQNHVLERLTFDETKFHRVDGAAQTLFDSLEAMRTAMQSPEQSAAVEDQRHFLTEVTILIQNRAEKRRWGDKIDAAVKFIFLVSGITEVRTPLEDAVGCELLAAGLSGVTRYGSVTEQSFTVRQSEEAGKQPIEAVLELWVSKDAGTEVIKKDLVSRQPNIVVISAFMTKEIVIVPES
jgi:uncharacterized protein (TIGR02118 family)